MLTDLRAINNVIQPMGSLHPGIPLPSLIPKGIIVINLKDCFFTIPLQENGREKFVFTVPTLNNSQPVRRYQWRVLPQGMLNSPTLCQHFVQQPLEIICKKFSQSLVYRYMGDILLPDSNKETLECMFEIVKDVLSCWGLQIAPEKIQRGDSINYLGYKIDLQRIRPQKVPIRRDHYQTLNSLQKLLGEISQSQTIIGVEAHGLKHLKMVLKGDTSVQKAELYAILMVLMDFTEPLNIVTDSQYAERVVLHIEPAEFIPDDTELTLLFIQLQETIRNRNNLIYITHIRSHTGLPGSLAQGNDEIDRLLIGSVLEASEFHRKHHVNSKGLKKDFSITWQQVKEIVRNCPTCSFYNQTPLPADCNPKGIQRNEVWQMDVFHFAEFGNLKYVHHTIDKFSGFHWATALNSEKADSVIVHLLEVMAVMGIPAQIKTDNAPGYVSTKLEQSFKYYKACHWYTTQAVVERSNRTLKEMLHRQD
ncbi:HERV-K_3q27.3 provirus ancestral Pol protein [Cricetulus griseus]|uniref:HERV-K_3q27.3 provirus ancestral Pol protein n=1 Tax=Cricetulus griseus TaxID=10029 RepID=G3HX71_CRIGR|nr:HERV-K_3q27.3 provirus ancestral Pol protein [Cricetulus griseus]